jgi:hypothetical protein
VPYKDPEKYRAYHRGKWKRYSKKNKSKIRAKNFRDRYGIEVEDYEALKEQQGGKCAICETTGRVLYVDHCHSTQKLRGLLCQQCNTGIGMLQDSIKVLKKAVRYLEKYETAPAKLKSMDAAEMADQVG